MQPLRNAYSTLWLSSTQTQQAAHLTNLNPDLNLLPRGLFIPLPVATGTVFLPGEQETPSSLQYNPFSHRPVLSVLYSIMKMCLTRARALGRLFLNRKYKYTVVHYSNLCLTHACTGIGRYVATLSIAKMLSFSLGVVQAGQSAGRHSIIIFSCVRKLI